MLVTAVGRALRTAWRRGSRAAATGRHAVAPGNPGNGGMLTPRQREAYDFIAAFLARRGYAPSYEEIRRHLGLASLNAVAKLVAGLRRRGALEPAAANAKRALAPAPRGARPASVGPHTVPLLGVIAAGEPLEPLENPEPIEVPPSLAGPGERYALRVRGDSMIEDGIRDGDVVVVRRAETAQSGQTVVAVVDGEATLKRFHRRGDAVELRPANAALAPIVARADRVAIRGVLVGLLRRYA